MPYNFVADSFHTKKLCSGVNGGLGARYDDHLRLIGERVVDFLLMLT